MVKNVESQSEFHVAVRDYGYTLLVVDFFATWCGPCVTFASIYKKLAYEYSDCIFLKVDVDELEDVASECGITAMPTFQCYRGGKKIDELVGANEDKLREMIEKNM